ncbi:MAG: hypothetical protein ACJ8BF_10140 [Gemmatimonadales bacterium]
MRGSILLMAAFLSFGCSRENGGNASASAYTSDSDSGVKAAGVEGTNSGTELEAPRLIPAMQNQLNLMSSKAQPANPDNLTAYKNLAGDLVNSMAADMYRAGLADSGSFRSLRDSVMEELGGGAGTPSTLDRSKLPKHIAQMRRLISTYQQGMRDAGENKK